MTDTATKPSSKPKPPGWGNDELSKFLENAHQNQYATFVNKRDAMAKLSAIDALFAKVTTGWINPENPFLAMLFIRCLGAYRTACGLAMAGQAAECYVQCRSALEYAAYAVHINCDPSLEAIWIDRHRDEASVKASRKVFQHSAVLTSVKAATRGGSFRENLSVYN